MRVWAKKALLDAASTDLEHRLQVGRRLSQRRFLSLQAVQAFEASWVGSMVEGQSTRGLISTKITSREKSDEQQESQRQGEATCFDWSSSSAMLKMIDGLPTSPLQLPSVCGVTNSAVVPDGVIRPLTHPHLAYPHVCGLGRPN
jgi:hypothetical protein